MQAGEHREDKEGGCFVRFGYGSGLTPSGVTVKVRTCEERKRFGIGVSRRWDHISQINKEWDCSDDSMGKYCTAVRKLEDKFEGLEFDHVERDRNTAADTLSKLGSSRTQVPPRVFVQEILHPSISLDRVEECNALSQPESNSDDWRELIIKYIKMRRNQMTKMQQNELQGSQLIILSSGKRYTEWAHRESS
jgi:hypothetical protein